MTHLTLSPPQRGWFDVLDDLDLKRDRFVFVIGLDYFFFPLLYLAIGGWTLLVLRLSQVGTLTDSRLVILRCANFLTAGCVNAC